MQELETIAQIKDSFGTADLIVAGFAVGATIFFSRKYITSGFRRLRTGYRNILEINETAKRKCRDYLQGKDSRD